MATDFEERESRKARFIELRAKGNSLARCAKQLGIAKSTACNWGHELEREIGRARAVELEALMERYAMMKEARIAFLAEQLTAIRKELKKRGLGDVPTAKILEAQLTYWRELMAEALEVRPVPDSGMGDALPRTKTGTKLNAEDIVSALQEVLEKRRAGSISAKEAKDELVLLQTLLRAHDQAVLENQYERLEAMLNERKKSR